MDEGVKNYFESSGYKVLNKKSLAGFFKKSITEKTRSVVVFASNLVPSTVYDEEKDNHLIKDYLMSGGKIVFLGPNPLAFITDEKTGRLKGIDFNIPSKFFGVDYKGELTDAMKGWFYSHPTKEGEKWGLTTWWVGIAGVNKNQVSTVLAEDETGNASAWVKSYGGPEGTGLVQLWVNRSVPHDLAQVKRAAEYGL